MYGLFFLAKQFYIMIICAYAHDKIADHSGEEIGGDQSRAQDIGRITFHLFAFEKISFCFAHFLAAAKVREHPQRLFSFNSDSLDKLKVSNHQIKLNGLRVGGYGMYNPVFSEVINGWANLAKFLQVHNCLYNWSSHLTALGTAINILTGYLFGPFLLIPTIKLPIRVDNRLLVSRATASIYCP